MQRLYRWAVNLFQPAIKPDKKKKEWMMLGPLLQRIAPRIGASVIIEPEWGIVGQITFKNGAKRYFRYNTVDLNPVGASDLAKDKDYAAFFMSQMGYPVVTGRTFFSDEWARTIGSADRRIDDAYQYAVTLGLPVIVKPNSGSQGSGVELVHNRSEFYRAMHRIFKHDRVALVQTPVKGHDYRVVVLDGRIISAYERIPLAVVGDAVSSIAQLLQSKQKYFESIGRDTQIKIDDPRIAGKLRNRGMSLSSRPQKGVAVQLLDNANLSTGGDSVDVTKTIHPEFAKIAINLTRDMGLRMCGVDFMIEGTIDQAPKKYWILEINAAPGLDHYAKMGAEQEKIVEDLYMEVLLSLEKGASSGPN